MKKVVGLLFIVGLITLFVMLPSQHTTAENAGVATILECGITHDIRSENGEGVVSLNVTLSKEINGLDISNDNTRITFAVAMSPLDNANGEHPCQATLIELPPNPIFPPEPVKRLHIVYPPDPIDTLRR